MPALGQVTLIEKMIKFIEIDRCEEISEKEKADLREGLCFGFSVVYSYINSVEKLSWWMELLTAMSYWDEKAESLDAEVIASGALSIGEKEKKHLEIEKEK